MSSTESEILERLRAKDEMLFGLSDILDAKAGLALLVITFLATQSAEFLSNPHLPQLFRWVQVAAVICLIIAGVACVGALWPRDHASEGAEELDVWANQLREFYKDAENPEAAADEAFRKGMALRLKERIAFNAKIGEAKSDLVTRAYNWAGVGLALNLSTLLALALA